MSDSSVQSDSPLLQVTTQTATWVGKLRRDRPKDEVARLLVSIGHTYSLLPVMESHFRAFCGPVFQEDVWADALRTHVPIDTDVDALRQMYWTDNPDLCLLETRTYEDMKRLIEHSYGYWKNGNPVGYARVEPSTGEITLLCLGKMRDVLQDKHFYQWGPADDNNVRHIQKVIMGPRWLADENKRYYDRIVVDPTNSHASTEFNLWPGFAAESVSPVEHDPALLQPILRHVLEVLASGVQAHADYILDWMAFLVQKPARRTQTLLLFYGQQGVGKGVVWDFLRQHVLGPKVCTQTANARTDLFGRFSNSFVHKRLVQLDEAQDVRDFEDDIKNKITATELRYEKKNQDTITVTNFTNFVVTTNNAVTLRVAHDDRRLVFFRCSDAHRNDSPYFSALFGALTRQPEQMGRALFQFFMERDLTKYANDMSFQLFRPITDFYLEMRADSLRPEQLFFSALVNMFIDTDPTIRIHASELYKAYKNFATDMAEVAVGHKVLHCTAFGKHLTKFAGAITPSDKLLHGHRTYFVHLQPLRATLQKLNMYDSDAFLRERPPLLAR